MTMYGYEIKNEYGRGAAELYRTADQDNPEAILEGISMAGLVGFLKQLGDLAEFAADIFHGLHEEVTNAATRSENLIYRVQQLEEDLPLMEESLYNDDLSDFAFVEGISWHPYLETGQNLVTKEDMSSYVMEFYKGSRGPPQLFRLDKFDGSGQGACLKRYTDPSFFTVDLSIYGFAEENFKEDAPPKAMIMSNSSGIEIAKSLRVSKSESRIIEEKSDEIQSTRVKLKRKQFKGSLLSSMQNIFEIDSPIKNNISKIHSNTKTNNADSSHKRFKSLGSLITLTSAEPDGMDGSSPDEMPEKSHSSEHLSSSNHNDQMDFIPNNEETESEGNNNTYNSEETPSEIENYVDALTTMVEMESEVEDIKQDSPESRKPITESQEPNSQFSKGIMKANIINTKLVRKTVSMKVSYEEESEKKSNRKLVKDSFSHSLRYMAQQILDFKGDMTEEEEFDSEGLDDTKDEFIIDSPDVNKNVIFEKGEGSIENVASGEDLIEKMEDGDLVVVGENEIGDSGNLEMDVIEKFDTEEELQISEEIDEMEDSESLEIIDTDKLDSGEKVYENGERNVIREFGDLESNEMVEDFELELGEDEEKKEMENLDFEQEIDVKNDTYEIQKSPILEQNEIGKFDSQEELHESEKTNEILESENLETNEMENLDYAEEMDENEEIKITEPQIIDSNDIENLDSGQELYEKEEIYEILEYEKVESNEMETFESQEESHENEETNEIQESQIPELNKIEKLESRENLHDTESEETNTTRESQILETNEIEMLEPQEKAHENEIHETNEINEESIFENTNIIEKNRNVDSFEMELDFNVELEAKEDINIIEKNIDLTEENIDIIEKNMNIIEETKDITVENKVKESLMNQQVLDKEIPESQILSSIDELLNKGNSVEANIDHYELLKEDEQTGETSSPVLNNTSSPVPHNTSSPVPNNTSSSVTIANTETKPAKSSEMNFEDIFSSYGISIPLPSISNQNSNHNETISKESNEASPPLPPLPPIQWRLGKPPLGPALGLMGQVGPVPNFGKLGRPPRPKPSRAFSKFVKNPSRRRLNFQEVKGDEEKKEIILENESLPIKDFDSKPINGIFKNGEEIKDKEELSVSEKVLKTGDEEIKPELEKEEPKKKDPSPVPTPPKYPMFQVTSHDKTMLKKAPELIQPSNRLITPSMLEEIRSKSFSLKPVLIRKPNVMGQYKRTNIKVAAMLEKAHAIRQAVASSDDSDNDSWSE